MSKISNIFSMLELLSNGKIYKISELAETVNEINNDIIKRIFLIYICLF